MEKINTLICYSSKTGNTKKVAEIIFEICPFNKDIFNLEKNRDIPDSDNFDLIIVGYWVESSKANSLTIDFLNTVKNKRVVLFGTAGTDVNHPYVKSVISKTENEIDSSNDLLGHFICQGQISEEVITNFEFLANSQPENKMLSALLKIFKEQYPISIGHPNMTDLQQAKIYFSNLFNNLK
jgi:flavodoxin